MIAGKHKNFVYDQWLAQILERDVYLTLKMSFANTLAEICERVPGGDVDAVSEILGRDRRIGRKFLTGAVRYGGPCFPRDNKAFSAFARKASCQAKLSRAADEVNEHQDERIVELIKRKIGKIEGKTIAILGLTYKPNTDIVLESAAIGIGEALLKEGARLRVYDPAGMENARSVLGQRNIKYATSATDCLKGAELCILVTLWDEFKRLKPEDFTKNMKKSVLLDCWRTLNRSEFSKKLEYLAVGLNISK